MGEFINRDNDGFKRYANGEYVDKTGMIGYVNTTINTPEKLICVTRPRRFGKSAVAQMLYAYYDKSCDSRSLFERFEVAHDPTFEQHLNKYPSIVIDMTSFTTKFKGRGDIVDIMQKAIMKDVCKAYPDIEIEEYADLALIPRYGGRRPAVVVELKWNKPVTAAIDQIHQRNYPEAVRRFTDNILLVGISYDEKTKQHTCEII